jgi:hypothetical protein
MGAVVKQQFTKAERIMRANDVFTPILKTGETGGQSRETVKPTHFSLPLRSGPLCFVVYRFCGLSVRRFWHNKGC